MVAESVHSNLRKSFKDVFIPDHILNYIMEQKNPLEKMYDFYVDSGYLKVEMAGHQFCREYAKHVEYETVKNQLHSKIKEEYRQFVELLKERPPYDIPKLISEMTIKMQIFSMIRYDDCFSVEDMLALQGVDKLLEKGFQGYKGDNLVSTDTNYLWAITMDNLEKIIGKEKAESVVNEDELEV